jgi:hypothetical protein
MRLVKKYTAAYYLRKHKTIIWGPFYYKLSYNRTLKVADVSEDDDTKSVINTAWTDSAYDIRILEKVTDFKILKKITGHWY